MPKVSRLYYKETAIVYRMFAKHVPGIAPEKSIALMRSAYNTVSEEVHSRREKFCMEPSNIEKVLQLMGNDYAHLRSAMLGYLLITAAKNPGMYGGGWAKSGTNNHGGKKGYKDHLDNQCAPNRLDFYRRINESTWPPLRAKCFARDGMKCRMCNSDSSLRAHHRSYNRMRTKNEIDDLTTVCETCHRLYHFGISGKKKVR